MSDSSSPGLTWDEKNIETIAGTISDGLCGPGYAVLDGFLSAEMIQSIRTHMDKLRQEGEFKEAGIGNVHQYQVNSSIRKDWIHWINHSQPDSTISVFVQQLRQVMDMLNRFCFLGLKDFEMHYAMYPTGAYYKRHLDQFKSSDHRRLTFICYLNTGWQPTDGGLLRMFLKDKDGRESPMDVSPVAGRLVFFRSDQIEHEVILCHRQRYSVTGWMLDQLNELTFL
ncbi:MAG: 2OG-Fe(II) oxygenase [Candidatus Omnitrophica bacterium]|nr:2OG-Fe(II) oxygenase [Candidatus Omnitrophota bacterium]